MAQSYEERYCLLTPKASFISPSLPRVLWYIAPRDEEDTIPLRDYTEEELEYFQVPETPEIDPGPLGAWRQAHWDLSFKDLVYSNSMRDARRWGYVMWDYSRLLESGFFAFPYTAPPPENNMSEEDRLDAVMESLIERRRLFWKGARGWWSKGDESHLQWERPMEVSDDEEDTERFRNTVFL